MNQSNGFTELIQDFLSEIIEWASAQPDVTTVALVGSYARNAAHSSSDIDLVILTNCPGQYFEDTGWASCFGSVEKEQVEDWGKVTSLRVWYASGKEVEFGFARPQWAEPPLDEGTRRVIADGIRVLFDRDGALRSQQGFLACPPLNPADRQALAANSSYTPEKQPGLDR